MGIRFYCPNGHKLNVKSFLAGKKGVCPDCGVKLRIPERSEPGLDSGIDEGKQTTNLQQVPATAPPPVANMTAVAAPAARAVVAPTPAPMAIPAPRPAQVQPAYVPPQPVRAAVAQPAYAPQQPVGYGPQPAAIPPFSPPAGPIMPPPPPPMPGASAGVAADPIAENPLATWFVRPPSGGQFGPARGEVMRKWLTEGRVTSDSLVWREGWIDWLAATEVFPSLGKQAPTALFGVQPVGPKSTAAIPAAGKKQQSSAMSAAILAMLAVICLVLVGVLAVLLSGGFGST